MISRKLEYTISIQQRTRSVQRTMCMQKRHVLICIWKSDNIHDSPNMHVFVNMGGERRSHDILYHDCFLHHLIYRLINFYGRRSNILTFIWNLVPINCMHLVQEIHLEISSYELALCCVIYIWVYINAYFSKCFPIIYSWWVPSILSMIPSSDI